MSATRPLIALLAALAVLFSLPVAGASAGQGGAKSKHARHHHSHKAKKHRKHKRKHARKHARTKAKTHAKAKPHKTAAGKGKTKAPAGADSDAAKAIGTISAIDGDLITVALTKGGTMTGQLTEDSVLMCANGTVSGEDDGDDADSGDDPADDDTAADDSDDGDDGDDGDDDDFDVRSARTSTTCAPAIGDPVYDADLDDGVFDLLDLSGV